MKKQTHGINLTNRDMDVMKVLWESESPKTAAMIIQTQPELTMNTVQAVLRKLLKNKMIEVADIVYSGTVLSRCYKPVISQEDFILNKMADEYQSLNKKISKVSIFSALLDTETDSETVEEDIRQMKQFLNDYTKNHSAGTAKK